MIDPRGTRFSAALTTVVLAFVVATFPSPLAGMLLAWQTLVFALGAILGPAQTPYAWLFRRLVRPRLQPPAHTEDALPPQFAQAVGLFFAMGASVCALLALPVGVWLFAGFALLAAFLNAAFGICLGCEVYVRIRTYLPSEAIPGGRAASGRTAEPQPVDLTQAGPQHVEVIDLSVVDTRLNA